MARRIPIIKLRGNLIVSIQIDLSDELVSELKENIAHESRQTDVFGLVIEVSGVDTFDSYIARSVREIAQIARCMGVATVLAGLDAAMAITLVEMGMDLEGVETTLNLESAIDFLDEIARERAATDEMIEQLLIEELDEVTAKT
ncbi:MAG: STAS domain-containing protein [Nannocystaceae bacterium]|nr:STAS domain-containing protein [Myxococcales bacterium]